MLNDDIPIYIYIYYNIDYLPRSTEFDGFMLQPLRHLLKPNGKHRGSEWMMQGMRCPAERFTLRAYFQGLLLLVLGRVRQSQKSNLFGVIL